MKITIENNEGEYTTITPLIRARLLVHEAQHALAELTHDIYVITAERALALAADALAQTQAVEARREVG